MLIFNAALSSVVPIVKNIRRSHECFAACDKEGRPAGTPPGGFEPQAGRPYSFFAYFAFFAVNDPRLPSEGAMNRAPT